MDQLNEEPRNKVLTVEKQWDSNKNIPYRTPKKATYFSFPNLRPLTGIKAGIDGIKMGFNFNPAFSNKGFSLGGGMSASIPWSDRLSTEIGATYTVLTIGKDMEAVTADTISTQLTGMRNTVGMVALPISINYLISENFSAGIGLTPFKVVRDQRTDILASYRWTTGGNSAADTIRRLITERSKVRRSDSLYKTNTSWGFIQLSGRIHPPILRRYHTVVAPYINVPIGTLHNDRDRWLQGGVSIRDYLRGTWNFKR